MKNKEEKSILELDNVAQELFGVYYNDLGLFAKWEVEDYIKENKCKNCNGDGLIESNKIKTLCRICK